MSQQGVAVPMMNEKPVLLMGYETTAPPQGPPAHLEDLQRGILGEHKVLVGPHEAEDNGKGSAQDHQVGSNGHGTRGYHCAQINPALDGRCQLRDAL